MSQAVITQDQSNGLLNFIERASRDPEFDIVKFEALLRMQREVVQEQAQRQFNQAMANAQTEMMPIIRDATNTHTQSKYAKLETIDRAMRPIYTSHGFSVRFGSAPAPRSGDIRIVCTVSHVGGYSETNYLDGPPDAAGSAGKTNKTAIQAIGATVTYLRRYLLAMVFNIVLANDEDDDDGNTTSQSTGPRHRSGNGAAKPPDPLDEGNPTQWIRNFSARLRAAQTPAEIVDFEADPRVIEVYERKATQSLKDYIDDEFRKARVRIAEAAAKPNGEERRDQINREVPVPGPDDPPADWADPIAELLGEVGMMDLVALNGLAANAEWRAKVREAATFPPDQDRLDEAIAARKAALQGRA